MMPLALFASRAFAGLTVLTFLVYGALGGLLVLLPYVLIQSGYSALHAGFALLPFPAGGRHRIARDGARRAADRAALAADAGPAHHRDRPCIDRARRSARQLLDKHSFRRSW
ncbi:MAG: hypothetical protein WDN44_10420 [Sphingomonas sp.]